ncbi:condensation domain-containing protein [Staphylococcus epidermidis]|uniref:condensation domain-containing protein n=1 Tax=Staphylococcus epidermidis TaxID=1282 RepID=UPI000CD40E80|nr:condensation domain-containing protein [Staphylococcus epidermidis]MBM6082613.1 hypothetical protein [Staphylococcus epidermidis]MEB6727287.1 condensation domain-containing protein [Staphylococcus epidermidis]QRT38551.1 hypothetical protein I6K91_11650 [Staphylococcus epidermidis]
MIKNFNVIIDDENPLQEVLCPENLKEKWIGAMIDSSGNGENYSAAIRLDFSPNCNIDRILHSIIKVLSLNPILASQFKIINKELIAFVPTSDVLYKSLINSINNINDSEVNDKVFKESTKFLKSPKQNGLRFAYSKKHKIISVWIGFWTFTCDGMSIDILIKDIIKTYNGEKLVENNTWTKVIDTKDFLYKKDSLNDLDIYIKKGPYGIDNVRNTHITSKGSCKNINFNTHILTKDINLIAKRFRVTPFTIMFGIFQNTIIHLSDVSKIVTGVPYTNRRSSKEISCIGPFSNTIPIITEKNKTDKINREFFLRIQKKLILASERQNISPNKYYPKDISPRNVDYILPFPQIFNAWNSQQAGKKIMLNDREWLELNLLPNNTTRSGFELTLSANKKYISGHIDVDVDAYGSIIPMFKEKMINDLKNLNLKH